MIDFDLAIAWHKTFLHHLDRELAGAGRTAALRHPCDDNRCALGRWLAGAGQACRHLPAYAAVSARHRDFHDQVCDMMQQLRDGQAEQAAKLRATAVRQASIDLVAAIESLQQQFTTLSPDEREALAKPAAQFHAPLQWDDSYNLGLLPIDQEHQQLTALANRLHERPDANCHDETVVDILTAVGKFLVIHFQNEEAIMRQLGMPDELIAEHMRAHNYILDQYAELNIAAASGTTYRATDIFARLMDWIERHMLEYDMRIKDYLPARG